MTLYTRIMLVLTMVWLLPILLIRAQPYDDNKLRAFLIPPEGCPAPCFMGIRPGVTTEHEAIALLEDHQWVSATSLSEFTNERHLLWDDPTHPIIDAQQSGSLRLRNQVVQNITLSTNLKLSDVLTVYGPPASGHATPVYGSSRRLGVTYQIAYQPDWPLFEFFVPAGRWPGKLHTVLDSNIIIYYGLEVVADSVANPYLLDFIRVE